MPIDVSFHFTKDLGDDIVIDACKPFSEFTVADLSELGNHMVARVGPEPIVVIARHFFIAPDGTPGNEWVNAYLLGNPRGYCAVNMTEGPVEKRGCFPLLDFDRDYALYLEAVDSCGALEA
jgi:hypothetical protein